MRFHAEQTLTGRLPKSDVDAGDQVDDVDLTLASAIPDTRLRRSRPQPEDEPGSPASRITRWAFRLMKPGWVVPWLWPFTMADPSHRSPQSNSTTASMVNRAGLRATRRVQIACSVFRVDRRARIPAAPCGRPFTLHSPQHRSHMKHWQALHHRSR